MTRFALSTMYAQHPRFDDGAEFARYALAAGYDAIEISHSTPDEKTRAVVASGFLPVASVHAPAPWALTPSGIPNADLNLASLDEAARVDAVDWASRSIELASEVGARAVVLHLGHVESPALVERDRALRGLFPAADLVACELALRERLSVAPPYLAAARRSLVELADRASERGVVLGVESRLALHEIPHPSELPLMLQGFQPEMVGYWHDVGHTEALHRIGYVSREQWFSQPGVHVVGAHVHDATGITDHRAPGRGDVDLSWHLARVAHLPTVTLEINQFEPDEAVAATPGLLRSLAKARS